MRRREELRRRRKLHIRKKISGTAEKPRVFIKKTLKYIYVGVADDDAGKVLKSFRGDRNEKGAKKVGGDMGKWMKKQKIETAVFDRSGYKYHGLLAAVADEIRKDIKL